MITTLPVSAFAQDNLIEADIFGETIDVAKLTNEAQDIKEIVIPGDELNYAEEYFSIDVDQVNQLMKQQQNYAARGGEITGFSAAAAAAANNTPNTAWFISEDAFGNWISGSADGEDHWYIFNGHSTKHTIALSQEYGSYYVIEYIWNLGSGILYPVASNANGSTLTRTSYVDNENGIYFIRLMPLAYISEPYDYKVMLSQSSSYDAYEINDFTNWATPFTNSIDISASIDNAHDYDFYKLTMTSAKDVTITLSNAPSGNQYAVYLYTSDMSYINGGLVDGSYSCTASLSARDYYIMVFSNTGYFTNTPYKLRVEDAPTPPQVVDSYNMPWTQIDELCILPVTLRFEPGGQLVFDMSCYSVWGSGRERIGVVVDVRFDEYEDEYGPNEWERWGDFWVTQGSGQYTFELPYRRDHVVGRPLYSKGIVRITLVPEGAMEVSGTINSMSR